MDAQAAAMIAEASAGDAQAAGMEADVHAYDAQAKEMVADVHNLTVMWTGRFVPALLKRAASGPYTFISATHDGMTYVDFYMDSSGASVQSEALSPVTFGCAVELGLQVSFSAALQPRAPPHARRQGQHAVRPAAHLSEHQKAALRRAVDAAMFVPAPNPAARASSTIAASDLAAASSTNDLASSLAPPQQVMLAQVMRLLEQQTKLIEEQRAEQRRQGGELQQLLRGGSATLDAVEASTRKIDALREQFDKFCNLSDTIKAAAAQSIDRHKAKVPAADEANMPSFGPDGSARLQARAEAAKRVDDFLRPLFGDDWAMLHASAPRQGKYTVHGKERNSGVERPYSVPKPDEVLRRTISMYAGMRRRASRCTAAPSLCPARFDAAPLAPHRLLPLCGGSKFACRPLGRASTDEVWTQIYAQWGEQKVWCAALGFGPDTEINVTPTCIPNLYTPSGLCLPSSLLPLIVNCASGRSTTSTPKRTAATTRSSTTSSSRAR